MTNLTSPITAKEAALLGSIHKGSVTFGHLSASYSIDTSIPQIIADASIYGVSIGHAVIDPTHQTATLGGKVGFVVTKLILTADFTAKELDYDVDVEVFGLKVVNKSGRLFSW